MSPCPFVCRPTKRDKVVVGTDIRPNSGGLAIKRVVIHPDFNRFTLDNDFAVIRLQDNIIFDASHEKVTLPTTDVAVGTEVNVTGWGTLSSGLYVKQVTIRYLLQTCPFFDCSK